MKRFTVRSFALVFLTLISAVVFSQEKTLPDNSKLITLMRQHGITVEMINSMPRAGMLNLLETPEIQSGEITNNAVFDEDFGVSSRESLVPDEYTRSAYANNFGTHEFVSVDVITGKQTYIANNTFDPSHNFPNEGVATFAEGVYYVCNIRNKTLNIKNDDGTEVPLGPVILNGQSVEPWGLAYDAANSTMYIKVFDGTFYVSLCTIDLNTLALTVIKTEFIFYSFGTALEFLPDGFLYSVDIANDKLVKINPANGNITVVGSIGFDADQIQNLSYEPTLGRLYSFSSGINSNYRYGYYNLTTGQFNPLTDDMYAYSTGFAIKDPLVLENVDAVAFYAETPEVVRDKFGVGETTPVIVKVGNYGMSAASFNATVVIGNDYSETISVTNLGSVGETEIVFPDWTPTTAGEYNILLTVSDPGGDGNLENNTTSRTINVYDGCRHNLAIWTQLAGWSGDWATVHVNTQVMYDSITDQSGEKRYPVYAGEGDTIAFTYYGDGVNNTYNNWKLTDSEENILLEGTGAPNAVIRQSAMANCPASAEANILTFNFNVADNPSILYDVIGVVDEENFTVSLEVIENANLSELIATFNLTEGATAAVGTVTQVSAVTPNDFTNPVVYTVTAEAGNTQDWTVTVNTLPCSNPWGYLVTGSIHTINIPLAAAPEIFGVPLAPLDWIGVFYMNDNGEETCGGAIQWTGTGNVAIIAYGDDPTTDEKDGFDAGEIFRWRLNHCGNPEDFTAVAAYDPNQPNLSSFSSFGLSVLTSLKAATIQYYSFNQGWNSISSYLNPIDPAVETMFSPIAGNLYVISNLTSVYWPSQGVNSIGNWNSNSGYVAKITEEVEFMIGGADFVSGTMTIPAGWSYLPVLSGCPADLTEMFEGNLSDVIIIQELIGTQIFWPQFEVYTLETFEPGKAYKIKLANAVTVTFPECTGLKSNFTPSTTFNSTETGWGTIKMTPYTQSVVFLANSLVNINAGDMIGAFDESGKIWGYVQINSNNQNQTITLFGDDLTTLEKDGFSNGENISFKLLHAETGEVFDLEVEYSELLENTSGNFETSSLAAISTLKVTAAGVVGQSGSSFTIFPNPAKDLLHITGITEKTMVRITTVFGIEVFRAELSMPSTINIGALSRGTYLVELSDRSGVSMNKLVIQ